MLNPGVFERKAIPIFWPNGVYSFGKCLREFCNWPTFLPIPLYLDHGSFVGLYLDHHEVENRARHHLTWYKPKYIEKTNKRYKDKKIVYITSPQILYKRANNIHLKSQAKGTLLFIPHTSGDVEWASDKKVWMTQISDWVEKVIYEVCPEPPVVLCFHQTDIKQGYHISLKQKFPIVTAGNSQSEFFIDRFYYLISHFKNSISNAVGTDLLLCHELGLNHTIFGDEPTPVIVTEGFDYKDKSDKHYHEKIDLIRKYFLFPKQKNEKYFRDKIIHEHLGLSSNITPDYLKKIFIKDFLILAPYFLKHYFKFIYKLIIRFLNKKNND